MGNKYEGKYMVNASQEKSISRHKDGCSYTTQYTNIVREIFFWEKI